MFNAVATKMACPFTGALLIDHEDGTWTCDLPESPLYGQIFVANRVVLTPVEPKNSNSVEAKAEPVWDSVTAPVSSSAIPLDIAPITTSVTAGANK